MEVGTTISIKGLKGIIRYVGEYHEKPGIFVGVELEKPKGKNNGTIKGKKYFECPENHGLFVDINTAKSIMKIESGETPEQSPRIDLNKQISKSIDSIKITGKLAPPPNSKNQQQSTSNSNQANKPPNPVDVHREPHSAREPSTKVKMQNKAPNTNSILNPESQSSTANPAAQTPTTPAKPTPATQTTPSKPNQQRAPSTQAASTSTKQAGQASTSSSRRSAMTTSQSNPNLASTAKGNAIKTQSARPPANAAQSQAQQTPNSTHDSNLKSDSSENVSKKPQTAQPKPTPEKSTAPIKSSSTTPIAGNKSDSTGKVQSARPPADQQSNNQPQMPHSAREPPPKQAPLNPQNTQQKQQNPPQQQQQPKQQQQQQPQKQTPNTADVNHPVIPPLSIPKVQIEESELIKESASVSFDDIIKEKVNRLPASAMNSANRDRQLKSASNRQATDSQMTASAEQSDVENSPRVVKHTEITPEIKAKIKDLKAKQEGYEKQKALIKQKLIDILNNYKKKKSEQEKYMQKLEQESKNKLIELEISLETEINDLENQILESAERTHRYLEIADEQRANKVMELLRQINEEHVNFENDLDLFINAQRINVNTATQSVYILTERLKKVLMKRQYNEKLIAKKKNIITDRENELAEKRPRWQEVTQLRTTFAELSEKVNHFKKASVYKNAEKDGMGRFYQMFIDVPLLDSLYLVLCIEKKTENNDIRHICELTKFVLSGFIANTSKCYDLFNSLSEVNDSIEKDEELHSLISVSLALDAISSVPLDNALTVYQLKSSADKIKDEKLKNQLIDIIGEIKNSTIIHYALLEQNKKEEFIEFSKNLVFELRKAEADEEDEECNLEQFKGQLEKFNVPEFDVIKGFINFQMPQQATQDQKVIPEIAKKKQEKKDIDSKSKFLQEEIEKEKAKFESLRADLDEPMKQYIELADRLNAAKKKLNKYQIQNE